MAFPVETLAGLERKIVVSVPVEKIEEAVAARLKNLGPKAKISGFRPGKVPMRLIKQRYEDTLRHEVTRDMIKPSLIEALKEANLTPASYPDIEPHPIKPGEDFCYTAVFEVFPSFDIQPLNPEEDAVEIVSAEVSDSDVDSLLEELRERQKEWLIVSRPARLGDRLTVDFEGFVKDEPFEGNTAKEYEVVLGSGALIPGFEAGLVGASAGQSVTVQVTFPENYQASELAGQPARFEVTVHKVEEGLLPELDEAFAKKFNVAEGTIEALRTDIKENMMRELERKVSAKNRESIFTVFLKKNTFDLPKALVNDEIENLKHQMYHQIFGHEHHENEKIPDFPRELFEEQAIRRVHLGLLFSEYVKKHEIKVDRARVDAMIEQLAQAYEHPEELRAYYRSHRDRMSEIETLVLEEMVSERLMKEARLTFKTLNYTDVMHAKNAHDEEGV